MKDQRYLLRRLLLASLFATVAPGAVLAQTTQRANVSTLGQQANAVSADARISADGRIVAFFSEATNLVANDTNGVVDVFVHDRITGVSNEKGEIVDVVDQLLMFKNPDGKLVPAARVPLPLYT